MTLLKIYRNFETADNKKHVHEYTQIMHDFPRKLRNNTQPNFQINCEKEVFLAKAQYKESGIKFEEFCIKI